MATDESLAASVCEPIATECCPCATTSVPIAIALSPEAFVLVSVLSSLSLTFSLTPKPIARERSPEASAFWPIARETALSALLAFVPSPMAIELSLAAKPPSAAKEFLPSALEPIPKAVEASPEALLLSPQAVAFELLIKSYPLLPGFALISVLSSVAPLTIPPTVTDPSLPIVAVRIFPR